MNRTIVAIAAGAMTLAGISAASAQALDRSDGFAGDGRDLAGAGILRLAVDQHHAGATLLGAAAEFASPQAELVA